MKRGGPKHPKFARLGVLLGIPAAYAVGLMETLYEYAGDYAPQGDIGKLSDEEIAKGAGWPGEPKKFIDSAVEVLLFERKRRYRLVIHDWSAHAPDWVHTQISRKQLRFWDGTIPKLGGLRSDERPLIQRAYEDQVSKDCPRTVQAESVVTRTRPTLTRHDPDPPQQGPRTGKSKPAPDPGGQEQASAPVSGGSGGQGSSDAGLSSQTIQRRMVELGMHPASAARLTAAGVTVGQVVDEITEARADPKVSRPVAVAVKRLAERAGVRLLNGAKKPMGESVEQAKTELERLRALRGSG